MYVSDSEKNSKNSLPCPKRDLSKENYKNIKFILSFLANKENNKKNNIFQKLVNSRLSLLYKQRIFNYFPLSDKYRQEFFINYQQMLNGRSVGQRKLKSSRF